MRRSKRPLLAWYSRFKCYIDTSRNWIKNSNSAIRSSYVSKSHVVLIFDQWRVSLHIAISRMSCKILESDYILFDRIPLIEHRTS